MITRPVGSLSTQSSDLPECPVCVGFGPFPLWRTCSYHERNNCPCFHCASLVPLGMKWACIYAGYECCVWLCWYVSVCDSMCKCVLSSLCCWLRQCWRRCVGCCVVVTVQKRKTTSVITEKYPAREFISITVLYQVKKNALNYSHYRFILNRKNKICTTHFCNYFR